MHVSRLGRVVVLGGATLMAGCELMPGVHTPPTPPVGPPIALEVISGDGQAGTLGGGLLGEPFRVKAIDAGGAGVRGVRVTWRVTSGSGGVGDRNVFADTFESTTGFNGITHALFRPGALGTDVITANASPELQLTPVSFTVNTESIEIGIGGVDWWEPSTGFWGPPCPPCLPDVTTRVGTTVLWRNHASEPRTVTATSAPPGGTLFDSGLLPGGSVFHFVPNVAGTWEYVDTVTGSIARLMVE